MFTSQAHRFSDGRVWSVLRASGDICSAARQHNIHISSVSRMLRSGRRYDFPHCPLVGDMLAAVQKPGSGKLTCDLDVLSATGQLSAHGVLGRSESRPYVSGVPATSRGAPWSGSASVV